MSKKKYFIIACCLIAHSAESSSPTTQTQEPSWRWFGWLRKKSTKNIASQEIVSEENEPLKGREREKLRPDPILVDYPTSPKENQLGTDQGPLMSSLVLPQKTSIGWKAWILGMMRKTYIQNVFNTGSWGPSWAKVSSMFQSKSGIVPHNPSWIPSLSGNPRSNLGIYAPRIEQKPQKASKHVSLQTSVASCDKIIRIPVPVLQQGASFPWPQGPVKEMFWIWKDVEAEESGNCGYHALNNVLWVASMVARGDDIARVSDDRKKQRYLSFMLDAYDAIRRNRKNAKTNNWLGGNELEFLLKKYIDQKVLKKNENGFGISVVIVEHVPVQGLDFSDHVLRAVKTFVENDKEILGIVWNSGVRKSVGEMGGSHWVSFVLQHDGDKIKMYYMNSLEGLDPDFNVIDELLCRPSKDLHALIEKLMYDAMSRDLDRMELNLELIQGKSTGEVFEKYVGCVEYNGPFLKDFTAEQVRDLGIPPDKIDTVLTSLNTNWLDYVNTKRAQALSFVAKRFYAVWVNQDSLANAFDVSLKSCSGMSQKYHNPSLLVTQYGRSIIEPDLFFESMIHTCLVGWNNYGDWPELVQAQIANLLLEYLKLAQNYPAMITGSNWKLLGGVRAAVTKVVAKLSAVKEGQPKFVAEIEELLSQLER